MPPRPVYRWKSFWLGLFILLGLVWGWSWGRTHHNMIFFRPNPGTWMAVSSLSGYLWWDHHSFPPGHIMATIGERAASEPFLPTEFAPWFPPPVSMDLWHTADFKLAKYGIAHWMLILFFLISWAAFLGWRWRRMMRGAASN